MALSKNDRNNLNRNVPVLPMSALDTQGNRIRRSADLFFPLLCVIDGIYVTPGAGLNVNTTGGFVRDINGVISEVKPQTNYGTLTAPASGKSIVYAISYDPVAAAFVTTAGLAANTGTQVAPGFPALQVPIANVTIANGDTSPTSAHIDNTPQILV